MKIKSIIIATVLLVLGCCKTATAQLFKANVSAGFAISQIDGDELYGFKHLGFSGGVGVMMPIIPDKTDEGFQLSTEILLSQRGATNNHLTDPFEYHCNLTYIDVPLMIHYVDKRGGVTLGAGIQYGRLISTKESWTLYDTMINGMDRPLNINDHNFKKNDLSVVADFRFTIWRNFKFDVRWQYSLLPIRKDVGFFNSYNPDDDYYKSWYRDYKTHSLTFKIIYVFNEDNYTYRRTKYRRRR